MEREETWEETVTPYLPGIIVGAIVIISLSIIGAYTILKWRKMSLEKA